jgi:hypothetical protein
MTYPSFTSGEVLRAEDMNAVGLWLVKSQTIGTGVSSVAVSNAFSFDYDAYKIVVSGGAGSAAQGISMNFTGSTANYYSILTYWTYVGGVNTVIANNNGANWSLVGESSPNANTIDIDVINPMAAKFSYFMGGYMGTVAGNVVGYHGVATAYSGFTLSVAGTMTGGTISVYGYKK